MADITDPATRSRMMASIKGRDTGPELVVRKALHRRGLRYRVHGAGLAGRPDIVLSRHNVVVFVHGCFWHQHGCKNSNLPATRPEFWRSKLAGNSSRDRRNLEELMASGWRVGVVWECSIRSAARLGRTELFDQLHDWITEGDGQFAAF